MDITTQKYIDAFILKHGEKELIQKLKTFEGMGETLTIIANQGVHPLSPEHQRGEIFIASVGNLDFTSQEAANNSIREILLKVAKKLKEKKWEMVYLVPFGPAPLSLQIKSLVHKILDIETIDVLHAGSGKHFDISLDPREIAINASKN